MKKFISVVVLLSSVLILSGCLQIETKVYVNDDGSGVLEETVLFKDEVVEMMKQFVMAFDSTQSQEFNLFKEEELITKAKKYGEGVAYSSSERLKMDGFEGVKAKYTFTDISKLNLSLIADDAAVPIAEEEDAQKNSEEILKFSFSKSNNLANLKIYLPSMKRELGESLTNEEVNDSTFNEEFEKARQMFADMKMILKIVPAKQIKQTNADFINNNEITLLEMNLNSLLDKPDLFRELSGNNVKDLDDFRNLTKNIDGFRIESKNEILVSF